MPLPGFLKDLLGGGAAKLGEAVRDIIDVSKFSAEEKAELQLKIDAVVNAHTEAMATLAQKELETYLADVNSAREANTRIQESDKSSWISKNLAYLIDAFFVLTFGVMLFVIIKIGVPESNKELFYTAFGLLGGFVSTVVNFHRGTSIGSKSNGDALRKIVNR